MKKIVWTYFWSPFSFGRNRQPTGCEMKVTDRYELGKGFYGYKIVSNNNTVIIVEDKSGAIIGNNLNEVMNDIENSDVALMNNQIEDAIHILESVKIISEEEFWLVYESKIKINK